MPVDASEHILAEASRCLSRSEDANVVGQELSAAANVEGER